MKLILAILRISEIFVYEDIFASLRESVGIYHNSDGLPVTIDEAHHYVFFGKLLSCIRCTSVWVTAVMVIFTKFWKTGANIVVDIFALNKIVLLVNRYI